MYNLYIYIKIKILYNFIIILSFYNLVVIYSLTFVFFQINVMLPVPFSILKICACAARNFPSFKFSGFGTFRPMLPMWLLPLVCLRMPDFPSNIVTLLAHPATLIK